MDMFTTRRAKPMLAASASVPFDSEDCLFEPDLAGERCLAYCDGAGVDLISRRGRRLGPHLPELARLHDQVGRRCILDGVVTTGTGAPDDRRLLTRRLSLTKPDRIALFSRTYPAMYVAVDILYLDGADLTDLPLTERRKRLLSVAPDNDALCTIRWIEERGTAFHRLVHDRGLPGIVAKLKNSRYRMGKRSRDWLRLRRFRQSDFVVCGYTPDDETGTSLILGQYDPAGSIVYKGIVRLDQDCQELAIVENQPPAARPPFAPTHDATPDAVWLQPRLVCTVGFTRWSGDRRPCQPVFLRLDPYKLPFAARTA